MNGRIDHNFSDRDNLFAHTTVDKGVQATYTNLLNPLFDALSAQPSYSGQLGEHHTFTPALSNQFLFSTIYYVAVFSNGNQAAAEKLVPFTLVFYDGDMGKNGSAGWVGGDDRAFPQGRNVTGYQFQDDMAWTKGKHSLSIGWTMRRDDITDYSPSEYTSSPEGVAYAASFQQGYVDKWVERFPNRTTQPVALYDMGWYAQDQWKALPNLTITYGLRMEHNSNPICRTNCFAHFSSDFAGVNTNTATSYNKMIASNLYQAMPSLQAIGWEPRLGFAYLPFGSGSKTTVRGGFGMFADAFPGVIADELLNNAPVNVSFTVRGPGSAGTGSKTLLVPGSTSTVAGAPASSRSIATSSDVAFSNGFAGGANISTLTAALAAQGVAFSAPSMVNPTAIIKNPTYEEWSLAIEQQVNRFDSFSIMYVGNRSYHEPVENNGMNVYNGGVAGFASLPTSAPNPNFGPVTQISSTAAGNFNGVVLSAQHRSRSLTLTINYQWSHALDEISNGGFSGFSNNLFTPTNPTNLRQSYGNADYDIRQYVSSSYVYSLPHFAGPKLLVDDWQFSGTFFHSTGLPFSVIDGGTAGSLNYNGSGFLLAKQTGSLKGINHCGGQAAAAANPTACAFASHFSTPTDFGQSARNQLFGPNYTDTDLTVTKGFHMPYWEAGQLRVGAQFFNLFNHVNFGQPLNDLAGGGVGTINSAVNPPTSILGSFLGGDAAPRLVQLTAKFEF
jgi:hypothetical protein